MEPWGTVEQSGLSWTMFALFHECIRCSKRVHSGSGADVVQFGLLCSVVPYGSAMVSVGVPSGYFFQDIPTDTGDKVIKRDVNAT